MAGVLTFDEYLGGTDPLQMTSGLPSDQRIKNYNFGADITGWTFSSTYQVIVVDTLSYKRHTNIPNFANSKVIGSFPITPITGALAPQILDVNTGSVNVTIPAYMYTGKLYPNARENVPISILTFSWNDDSTPSAISSHRWGIIQTFGSSVVPGDPTLENDFIPLV